MTTSARPVQRASAHAVTAMTSPGAGRPLVLTGAMAAGAVMAIGLGAITPFVLAGWIAAPHDGLGLPGVVRTAADIWLAAHHVGFSLPRAGRIGMLPLGLVLLPGALLWRAGRWVVRTGPVSRLRHVGYAALALAGPYAVLAGALALVSRSALAAPSVPQAVVAGFLLALAAGGLGGARALAPWGRLAGLLTPRSRSLVLGTAGTLAVLAASGAVIAGASLAFHLSQYRALMTALAPGVVGTVLLSLAQIAYVPNAIGWAACYTLGPGFAFGTGTVVAPTGSALGPLPMFPMLAALPGGSHAGVPGWASAALLAVPYLAGVFGGAVTVRVAPEPAAEIAPLWGFACGVLSGCLTGMLAAFSGGPLGSGRLAAVGPSGWQSGVVATLEMGVAAAIAAGVANWLRQRRMPRLLPAVPAPARSAVRAKPSVPDPDDPHRIYLDPWAENRDPPARTGQPPGPASLPYGPRTSPAGGTEPAERSTPDG
ncbi:MAG: hypothetical protein J2P34_00865 [Actinobacteria bacterium]|nr:hypothetical protein [Actinomycetota bacterium]